MMDGEWQRVVMRPKLEAGSLVNKDPAQMKSHTAPLVGQKNFLHVLQILGFLGQARNRVSREELHSGEGRTSPFLC